MILRLLSFLVLLAACSDDGNGSFKPDAGGGDSGGDTDSDSDSDNGDAACATLFGIPLDNTGLSGEQCVAYCRCGGLSFSPPPYTEAEITAIGAAENSQPFDELEVSPYDSPELYPPEPDKFCGVIFDEANPGSYRSQTFETEVAVYSSNAVMTHHGACGLCSTLQDLSVYMRYVDLTGPVRDCGIKGMTEGEEANITCLQNLGFTLPCAQIWYYNTVNTRTVCLDVCIQALEDPYHDEDGSLKFLHCLR